MSELQTSGYVRVAGEALYASVFQPAVPNGVAVVIFDPFGEEKKCAYRLLVRLARAGAAAGFAVWRFDHSGCGQSSGNHAQAGWRQWQAEAEAVSRMAAGSPGTQRWVALGVRLGALAAVHAARQAGAAAVVLIEPILSGEDSLRDLERRQMIKQIVTAGDRSGDGAAAAWERGHAVDLGGFEIGPELAIPLRAETLAEHLGDLPPEVPLQVLRVSGAKGLPPAWAPLAERAAAVAPGAAQVVRDKPFWGQLEYYESDVVIDAVLPFLKALCAAPVPGKGPDVEDRQ